MFKRALRANGCKEWMSVQAWLKTRTDAANSTGDHQSHKESALTTQILKSSAGTLKTAVGNTISVKGQEPRIRDYLHTGNGRRKIKEAIHIWHQRLPTNRDGSCELPPLQPQEQLNQLLDMQAKHSFYTVQINPLMLKCLKGGLCMFSNQTLHQITSLSSLTVNSVV